MDQLIPENTSRKVDNLGRVTIPKGLRDRMLLSEGSELELFTAAIDGRKCIVLSSPIADDSEAAEEAIERLRALGYTVSKEIEE